MRPLRVGCYILLGILIAAGTMETVLRFLPVTRGLFRTLEGDLWPLHAFTPQTRYSYSMTWDFQNRQDGSTNNYGHLAPFDFVKDSKPIIVLGDSFIEAQMLAYADTLQGNLSQLLGSKVPVYGLGISGNSIAEHLALAPLAKREFQPRAAVVLLNDQDFSDSIGRKPNHYFFELKDGKFDLAYQSPRNISLARKIREPIGDSALYRYIFSNLRFSPGDLMKGLESASGSSGESPSPPSKLPQELVAVVDVFLSEFNARSGISPRCMVFLFDSDRQSLYKAGYAASAESPSALQQHFSRHAEQAGYKVVDTKKLFGYHYSIHRQRFDFSPIDGHWNWLGHKIAAHAAFEALRQSPDCL